MGRRLHPSANMKRHTSRKSSSKPDQKKPIACRLSTELVIHSTAGSHGYVFTKTHRSLSMLQLQKRI